MKPLTSLGPRVRRLWARRAELAAGRSPLTLIGIALLVAGVVLPWMTMPLDDPLRSTSMRLAFAGVPTHRLLTYGMLVAVCAMVAALATVVARGRPGVAGAWAGLAAVVVAVLAVIQSVVADGDLIARLEVQRTAYGGITSQMTYRIPTSKLESLGFIPLPSAWRDQLTAMMPGWWSTLAGGLLLLLGARGRVRLHRMAPGRLVAVPALAAVVLLVLVGRGVVAREVVASGVDASHAGDYGTARARFDLAASLNPSLWSTRSFTLSVGQLLALQGDTRSAPARLSAATAMGRSGDSLAEYRALEGVLDAYPADPVVLAEARRQARKAARSNGSPDLLTAFLKAHPEADGAAERYTLARIYYAQGDFESARVEMLKVPALSPDSNVASSAWTYIALCDMHQRHVDVARAELKRAIAVDSAYANTLARSLGTGLYETAS